jgi:putative ABC transport system permease protein
LAEGGLIVSTVLAQRTKLRVGDTADVATREGVRRLEVAATTNEYLASGLVVYMDRELARRLLKIEGIDGYMIKAQPEARDAARKQIQALCDKHGVLLHSYGDLARMIEGMIGSIDGALWAIIVLCFVVAAIGVVNTLTMNVLEQTRELGLLRIVAMTRGQVRATILTQAVIMGGIGLGPGTVIAILVSYLLHLAMLPICGHPVAFVLRPAMFGISLAAGMAIVLAAAWLPAERAARLDLTKALQYE